ncbi:hypothetical protein ACFX2I_015900 [Malus domestica]
MVIKQPCMAGVADFKPAPGVGLACHMYVAICICQLVQSGLSSTHASIYYSDFTMKAGKRKQGKCFQQKPKAKNIIPHTRGPYRTIHIKTQQDLGVNREQETPAIHFPT